MKNAIKLLSLCIVLLFFCCETEDINNNETFYETTTVSSKKGLSNGTKELVILYPDGTTELKKQQKRAEYNVTNYKTCDCADENLELWIFNSGGAGNINIEEKRETATADEDIEGADFNPIIQIQPDQFVTPSTNGAVNDALSKIVKNNNNITIGVLDTGINYNYPGFSNLFLYNSQEDGCSSNGYNDRFGWNFVDNNNNPFDDHLNLHGTIVSHIITSNLDANNVLYQLLPVKVANQNGNIKYFDALCGFKYATKKQNIKIINLSFGWTSDLHGILNRFIEDVEDDILVVCSAGNNQQNNDNVPHYPSSGESNNILSVAGLSGYVTGTGSNPGSGTSGGIGNNPNSTGGLSYFSNHGTNSVDVAAISENIPFSYNNNTYYVNGTSYSAAYASFFSAYNYELNMSATQLKDMVIINSNYSGELWKIKHSAYLLLD
jgi:hypothetical protein